jgi:hypothetical protein
MNRRCGRVRTLISRLSLLAALTSGLVVSVDAQIAVGRSNTGSLPVAPSDSSFVDNRLKTRALFFEMQFSGQTTEKVLNAKETGRLRLVITNTSDVTVRNVVAKLVPIDIPVGVRFADSINVGNIPAGGTQYAIFYFTAAEDVPQQVVTIGVEVHQQGGQEPDPRLLTFETRGRRPTNQQR